MTRHTQSRSKTGCLLTLMLSFGLSACGVQGADDTFSDIALPTFSKDRVAQEAPVEVRRLLSGSVGWDFGFGSPSPDGRFLTDIEWNLKSGVSLLDLATGEETEIPNQVPGGFADAGSIFSPDGSRVAYTHWGDPGYEVLSIGVDGSDPRVHLKYGAVPGEVSPGHRDFAEVIDWSKDGRYLLLNVYPREGEAHIATIDVNTNEYRIIKTVDIRGPGNSFFSPDGRFVAFDLRSDPSSREHDIFVVSADGSSEGTLLQTPDQERLLGWFPDGSGILFYRIAEDSRAVWKLPVQNGRPAGPPELIKDDLWHMTGFGFSDNDYFYGVTVSRRQVHTASFDLETGRMLEGLEPVVELSHPGTYSGAWSPDGRRLAYLSRDAGESRLIIRSLTGEILQDLPLAIDAGAFKTKWTPHGLLVTGTDRDGHRGVYLVSPETGEASFVMEGSMRQASVSEDGSKIFMDPGESDASPIIEHDLVTGMERTLVEAETLFGEVSSGWNDDLPRFNLVSPDGNYIAQMYLRGTRDDRDRYVQIISRSSGETRRTEVIFTGINPFQLVWSPDSRYVLFDGSLEEGDDGIHHYLFRYSVEDGSLLKLVEITDDLARVGNVSVSPDGRHVAMGTGGTRQEIWRMSFNSGG